MVATHDITKTRPAPSAFQLSLNREMARFHTSRYKIADQCGVGVSTIERWQKGEGIPDVQQFKRLVGMFRRLAENPPNWAPTTGGSFSNVADHVVHDLKKTAAAEERKSPQKAPEPQSFGAGLRRVIEDNGIPISDLGKLLGLASGAIHHWLGDGCAPTPENLAKLCELLPELQIAIDVGAIKRPKHGRLGRPRLAPPQLTIVPAEPAPVVVAPEAKREPVPDKGPTIAAMALATLSEAYVKARVAFQSKQRMHGDAELQVFRLAEELAEEKKALDAARAALDKAIDEASK